MGCEYVPLPGGGAAIACSRGRKTQKCCACSRRSAFQCDWITDKVRGKTCDAHLCPTHALKVDDDKHLCPVHQKAYEQWQERRQPAEP